MNCRELNINQVHRDFTQSDTDFSCYNHVNCMFVGRNDTCRQFTDEYNMAVDSAVYPCTYGDGFVPYNSTNTDLARASWCQYCHLNFEKFTKITCVETNTKQTGIQPKISYFSV